MKSLSLRLRLRFVRKFALQTHLVAVFCARFMKNVDSLRSLETGFLIISNCLLTQNFSTDFKNASSSALGIQKLKFMTQFSIRVFP
jgi:hypothetical protein